MRKDLFVSLISSLVVGIVCLPQQVHAQAIEQLQLQVDRAAAAGNDVSTLMQSLIRIVVAQGGDVPEAVRNSVKSAIQSAVVAGQNVAVVAQMASKGAVQGAATARQDAASVAQAASQGAIEGAVLAGADVAVVARGASQGAVEAAAASGQDAAAVAAGASQGAVQGAQAAGVAVATVQEVADASIGGVEYAAEATGVQVGPSVAAMSVALPDESDFPKLGREEPWPYHRNSFRKIVAGVLNKRFFYRVYSSYNRDYFLTTYRLLPGLPRNVKGEIALLLSFPYERESNLFWFRVQILVRERRIKAGEWRAPLSDNVRNAAKNFVDTVVNEILEIGPEKK